MIDRFDRIMYYDGLIEEDAIRHPDTLSAHRNRYPDVIDDTQIDNIHGKDREELQEHGESGAHTP